TDQKFGMRQPAGVCGKKPGGPTRHNYVATFIAWRRDTVQAMCRAIEDRHGKSWVAAIGNTRKFSECTLYGAFADTVQGGAGHFIDEVNVCPMHWFEPAPTRAELAAFVAGLSPREIAVGVQSFVKLDPLMFRSAIGLERRRSDAA
ncbi:MAG TPA: hypothetical protein PKE65_06900, partial [Rhizobiaceae bacterium]|nr:hypothetical protein [Rhizobiaceae bacterium]